MATARQAEAGVEAPPVGAEAGGVEGEAEGTRLSEEDCAVGVQAEGGVVAGGLPLGGDHREGSRRRRAEAPEGLAGGALSVGDVEVVVAVEGVAMAVVAVEGEEEAVTGEVGEEGAGGVGAEEEGEDAGRGLVTGCVLLWVACFRASVLCSLPSGFMLVWLTFYVVAAPW